LSPADFNLHVIADFLKAEGSYDLRPRLKATTAPVLLLQGRQDPAGGCRARGNQRASLSRVRFHACPDRRWIIRRI